MSKNYEKVHSKTEKAPKRKIKEFNDENSTQTRQNSSLVLNRNDMNMTRSPSRSLSCVNNFPKSSKIVTPLENPNKTMTKPRDFDAKNKVLEPESLVIRKYSSEKKSLKIPKLATADYIESSDVAEDDHRSKIISQNPKLFLEESITASR